MESSVHSCAEPFENDGGISAAIVKSVKRAMAGESSHELSAKVFTGQRRLIRTRGAVHQVLTNETYISGCKVVDAAGIEPATPSMSTKCSPAELRVRP